MLFQLTIKNLDQFNISFNKYLDFLFPDWKVYLQSRDV